MANKLDFENQRKKDQVSKKGYIRADTEMPLVGSYADRRRYDLDEMEKGNNRQKIAKYKDELNKLISKANKLDWISLKLWQKQDLQKEILKVLVLLKDLDSTCVLEPNFKTAETIIKKCGFDKFSNTIFHKHKGVPKNRKIRRGRKS
ncbi:hypothetical protein [Methylomonas koyamae]|uniref:hypothetical protein n=1 Tax=Methylomonas koyamae TaxID=702114 RepID=UPI0006CFBBBE|nr:hypothetical protein [Methylomonas koyamae]BBL59280.1 hypothetical protein MKFW12EY_28930 [Methylomonas koyamae]